MNAPAEHGTAPLGIVKRDDADFADWVAREEGFASTLMRYNDDELRLENYQLSFLIDESSYRCVEKSRQTGYSFVFAIEALARAHLRETHTAVFVSYNLADAKEKITYCRQLHEELPLEYQKKLVIDSKLEIGFRSNASGGRVSRIISNPSKAPRGKHGDIYLDELAHCGNDKEIYKGSTALILRSGGQLTVCSSPLGRRGVFWEIAREELRPYPYYRRQSIPWWLCAEFCNDVETAASTANEMTTDERVARFGKRGILEQYASLVLEDFQQEFEVYYSDEALTFFPYGLILGCCTLENEELADDYADLANARGRLTAGYDVGRRNDLGELAVFERQRDGRKVARMLKTFEKMSFESQKAELRALLTVAPIDWLAIDETGMGMNLAEDMEREFPGRAYGVPFSGERKHLWCNDFKIDLQRRVLVLPRSRKLIGQIHSIRKNITPAGRVTFDVDKSSASQREIGHADQFWACALGARNERGERGVGEVGVRIIG